MVTIALYIEGGGSGPALETLFRQGWRQFFESAGLGGRMPKVVRGGTRSDTFRLFALAVSRARPSEVPLLLVDSENPVAQGFSACEHLTAQDNWVCPAGTRDDQVFLMVQLMETWFLADRETLKAYFGSGFREATLRAWPNLEDVPKATVLRALAHSTSGCNKRYAKGKTSFELLGKVDPSLIERKCPHAAALLARLRN